MPHVPADLEGQDQIRAWGEKVDYLVQTLHEVIGMHDGGSHLNYAIYHDRYRRTGDGWKFAGRVYEIRYLDTTPLTGSPPHEARR